MPAIAGAVGLRIHFGTTRGGFIIRRFSTGATNRFEPEGNSVAHISEKVVLSEMIGMGGRCATDPDWVKGP